eukprot:5742321-Prymnesium_polylepis.1
MHVVVRAVHGCMAAREEKVPLHVDQLCLVAAATREEGLSKVVRVEGGPSDLARRACTAVHLAAKDMVGCRRTDDIQGEPGCRASIDSRSCSTEEEPRAERHWCRNPQSGNLPHRAVAGSARYITLGHLRPPTLAQQFDDVGMAEELCVKDS